MYHLSTALPGAANRKKRLKVQINTIKQLNKSYQH